MRNQNPDVIAAGEESFKLNQRFSLKIEDEQQSVSNINTNNKLELGPLSIKLESPSINELTVNDLQSPIILKTDIGIEAMSR